MVRSLPCITCALFIALNCSNKKPLIQKSNVLAVVGDKIITVQDFIRRAEYSIRPDYCKQSNYIHKKIVLNSLIAEKLTALEMERSEDKLLKSQNFQNFLTGRKEQAMRQLYYNDNFFANTVVPDSTMKKFLPLSGRTVEVNYINLPDVKTTIDVQKMLNKNVSISSIYNSLWTGEVPSRKINFFDKEPEVIHDLLFTGEINKGDILGPLLNEDGSYLVLKIIGWKDEVSITGKESKHRWNDISEMMKDKIAKKKYLTSVQKLMAGKKIDFNQKVFDQYTYQVSKAYLKNDSNQKQAMSKALWEEIEAPRKISLDGNVEIDLGAEIFTYQNKQWTVIDLNLLIRSHPLVFRKRKISTGDFRNQLKLSIADLLRDNMITKKCYEQGLNEDWRVTSNVDMWRDAYASDRFISILNNDRERKKNKTPVLYNILIDSLQSKYSKNIKINTGAFEKIELTSTDMVVNQRGLPYPIVVPMFPILTSDDRLDYGSKLHN